MIEYIKGEIVELGPAVVVIDCNGLGYAVNISLNTYSAIQGKKACLLYIYEAIREDAYTLYGFLDKRERDLFLMLISVSGIGGNTARTVLSAFSTDELINIITTENVDLMKSVKGIGLKTAQRVIIDLKDKMQKVSGSVGSVNLSMTAVSAAILEDAVSALTMLGFPSITSQKVVAGILKEEPDIPIEKVIKLALKKL